jgi:heme-degrading monooxygenase HmoA
MGAVVAGELILISVFDVPAADAEAFVAEWEKASDYLQSQPGYVDRALHQAVAPDTEFQFVNIARWRTAEDFRAATQSPEFREVTAGLAGYQSHPALYRVLRS